MVSISEDMLFGHGVMIGETLVISDLHYGYTADGGEGMESEYEELSNRIRELVDTCEPSELVLAGDIFHSFTNVPRGAQDALVSLSQDLFLDDVSIIATTGNHDVVSPSTIPHVTEQQEYYIEEHDTLVLHGHKAPKQQAETYVVGHLHPKVRVQGQKWPAYLYGDEAYDGGDILILPAFSHFVEGTALSANHQPGIHMPLITYGASLSQYQPIVWDADTGSTSVFPQMKDFASRLD